MLMDGMQPEVVPHPDEWMRQHFEAGRPLTDVRARKKGNQRRPDFLDELTGQAIWLSQCSPWVHERLQAWDGRAAPPKVSASMCRAAQEVCKAHARLSMLVTAARHQSGGRRTTQRTTWSASGASLDRGAGKGYI